MNLSIPLCISKHLKNEKPNSGNGPSTSNVYILTLAVS